MPSPRRPAPGPLAALLLAACGGGGPAQTGDAGSSSTTGPAAAGDSSTSTSGGDDLGPTTSGSTADAGTTTGSTADASTSSSATSEPASSSSETSRGLRPDVPPPCEPTTCRAAGKTCGAVPDGCDGELECGECVAPETCGPDNVCVAACVAVGAIFFDLGETLVEYEGDLLVPRPGAEALIAELAGLGVRVGVITNTPPGYTLQDLEDLFVDPAFLDEFEVVLLSSLAASPPKPDPAIYAEAHALLAMPPPIDEVAFVSENLAEVADQEQAPTQGARAAGMVGVHLSAAPPSPLADYTVAPDQLDAIAALAETEWLACDDRP